MVAYDVLDGEPRPSVQAELVADPHGDYNLRLTTTNFTFAPQQVNDMHVPGHGHAHIYVKDTKLARVYSHRYHIGHMAEDSEYLRVDINTNKHDVYAVDGVKVQDIAAVPDPMEGMGGHDH